MHNGGAYGDGTTENGVAFGCRAARTTGKLGQFPLASGRAGESGQDVLWSASGKPGLEIAQQLEMTNATVGKWRRRFLEQGIGGLHDELRPSRPRPISDERVAQ